MAILNNSDKYLLPILPKIVYDKLNTSTKEIKFIGGGSFGRVYKATLADGREIALKAYREQGSQHKEAEQLTLLSKNTKVKMPEVLFTYEDENTALLAMSFVEGKNVLEAVFLYYILFHPLKSLYNPLFLTFVLLPLYLNAYLIYFLSLPFAPIYLI